MILGRWSVPHFSNIQKQCWGWYIYTFHFWLLSIFPKYDVWAPSLSVSVTYKRVYLITCKVPFCYFELPLEQGWPQTQGISPLTARSEATQSAYKHFLDSNTPCTFRAYRVKQTMHTLSSGWHNSGIYINIKAHTVQTLCANQLCHCIVLSLYSRYQIITTKLYTIRNYPHNRRPK